MSKHPTLIKPPPLISHCSPIENVLSLLPLTDIGPDIFTNRRKLWHPPGARGIFGGAAIAQCLTAAQATIPNDFTIHNMHCCFVLAGNSEIPIVYHVERVRDGKGFITRTVQARQRGKCIFTTTMSFVKQGSGGHKFVTHHVKMPTDEVPPPEKLNWAKNGGDSGAENVAGEADDTTPFETVRCKVAPSGAPETKVLRQWIRARGRISDTPVRLVYEKDDSTVSESRTTTTTTNNHQAHLSALAYMSDSYFMGTVARVHNLVHFANSRGIDDIVASFAGSAVEKEKIRAYLENMAREETAENEEVWQNNSDGPAVTNPNRVSMMVSLDHAIFIHNPRAFRADEWMLTEMQTPWAGDGRGLVFQRMWTKDGILIATCVQEGAVRLQQHDEQPKL